MFTYTICHLEKNSLTLSKCNLQVIKRLCYGKLGSMVLLFNLDSLCTCLDQPNITDVTLHKFLGSGCKRLAGSCFVSWDAYSWCPELSDEKPDHPSEVSSCLHGEEEGHS